MLKKEPAVIIAALLAVVQGVLIFTTGNATYDASEILTPILTLLVGLLTRQKVASQHTVNEAGFTMGELKERAESSLITPATETK